MTSTYDFDLHGIVRIRLLDATPQDRARVARQLGPLHATSVGAPDITVRFVDRLRTGAMTYVGVGDTGFDEQEFYVLRGRAGVAATARLPFDRIGRDPVIVCERAMPAVPHLLALINLVALGKGVLPLHASAFIQDGLGVLVTGWSKSGKTESLLAAVAAGGHYVGDEWVYLTPDGSMLGLPEPIRVWAWHLAQQPALLASRPREERLRLATWRALASLASSSAGVQLPGTGLARRTAPILERQAYLQVPPAELFGADRIAPRARLDSVVLMLSHSAGDVRVGTAGSTEVPDRMAASLATERAPFLAHYHQFRFAFPDRTSPLVDTAEATESRLLRTLFQGRAAATVAHPYPCDLTELGDAVRAAARRVAQPARPPAADAEVSA